ncbi:Hypothetical protein, putative [Bodo saltans]|uniref:Uncharacterized protein n=1 Tax=Bodo saltans TaxID=75058 RepID=A0A0S4J1W7_BODSA|nr:Hypothetical protein, putative [Bodo saltans]|eukprot:CUG62126.1 Hypothetical protein, putative [Bodo saltans]
MPGNRPPILQRAARQSEFSDEFETESQLVASSTRVENPLQRARRRREYEHEQHMTKIRREMEQQREVLDQLLHPAGIEERMKEFRARERELRIEREERIRVRYEKSNAAKAARTADTHLPQPPSKPKPPGHLPPMLDSQDFALRDLRNAQAKETLIEVKKAKQHALVNSATKTVVRRILESGEDRKGFVRLEATLIQQFARMAVSRRFVRRQHQRSMSPMVLSLVPRRPQDTASGPQNSEVLDMVREVVTEAIDNAKILLTKEYVMNDTRLHSKLRQ